MKWLRKWYWFSSAFIKKYFAVLALGLIIGISFFANIDRIITILPIKPVQYIGRVGAYSIQDLPLDIQQQVSRGLTSVADTGEVNLDVAQTISVSDNATTYTVTLNPNASWSDGTRITTQDIQLNLEDVNVNQISDEVLEFTLQEPFAPFPSVLSQPLLKRTTIGRMFQKPIIIGLNDYQIVEVKTHNKIITSLVLESATEKIHYSFYPTEDEALVAFKLGQIDTIQQVSNPHLEEWPNVTVEVIERPDRYLALFFNTTDPNLQDKTTRQMLSYATPKPADEERVISPISRESWVYNPQVKTYDYSPETARSMLDRMRETNPNFNLELTLTTTPAYYQDALNIVQAWSDVGFTASVRVVPFPDTNDYQVMLIGQQIPKEPDQYTLWHSTQPTNITQYQNAKIDKLLEDGRQETSAEKRLEIYQNFQRFLVEDAPVAFLKQLPVYTIKRS